MRRSTTKSLLTVGLLSLGSLALIPSCADNNSSLFVIGVLAIDQSACVAKPDTTAAFLAGGVLDTAFTSSYTAFVLVGNQLTSQGSREQLRTETARISLRGAEVTLTTVDGKELGRYSTVGTGFVDSAAGDSPSYAAMAVNVIPAAIIAQAKAARVVLAKIRVFGDTLGNTSITSSELDFPIDVCEGCLVQYDTLDPVTKLCLPPSTTTTSTTAPPCIFGQDKSFSCTTCAAAYTDLCGNPANNPSYAPATTP